MKRRITFVEGIRAAAIPLAMMVALCISADVSHAANTNYLGAVQIADPTTPTQQATVSSGGALLVDPAGGTQPSPTVASFTNRSGSIATGATSQTLAAANTSRKRIVIQNPATSTGQGISTAESIFINFTSAATVSGGDSLELLPGGSYDSGSGPVTGELITVIATTISHKYVAKEE